MLRKAFDAAGLGLTGATVTGATETAAITNATAALGLVQTAISNLGIVQGAVGAGENLLNYATSLANSQITNLTASESSIKDANVAAEAFADRRYEPDGTLRSRKFDDALIRNPAEAKNSGGEKQ